MAEDDEEASSTSQGRRASEDWRKWFDVGAKLIGALAVVWLGWVGHVYQSSLSATSLLNKREQAESQLRAGMLHDLIEPIMAILKRSATWTRSVSAC